MKTVNDFEVINGVAHLSGVAYAEEALVVKEFLKDNPNIKYASIVTRDNRHFELKDNRLVFSREERFINPYYNGDNETNDNFTADISDNNQKLESRIEAIEKAVERINSIISKVTLLLNNI